MQMKIPQKYAGLLFAFVMSLLMAFLMSGVLTAVFVGVDGQFIAHWMNGFIHAWPIAFPAILVVAPLVRKIVATLTE
jgi:hypothetical protein